MTSPGILMTSPDILMTSPGTLMTSPGTYTPRWNKKSATSMAFNSFKTNSRSN